MKKFLLVVVTIILCLCYLPISASQEPIDMSKWKYRMLTEGSDQDSNVIVSRFINENDIYQNAFCLEPAVSFLPRKNEYFLSNLDNKKVFQYVKAFNKLSNFDYTKDNETSFDKNLYIATQLLIWKELEEIEFTFDGEDYSEYKELINNFIKNDLKDLDIEETAYLNTVNHIDGNFENYECDSEDIEVIKKDKNGLDFSIKENKNEIVFKLIPKNKDIENVVVCSSMGSQDIYYYDGEYNDKATVNVKLHIDNSYIKINYSKFDDLGNIISGAQFKVYEIDDTGSEELVFVKPNTNIDLFKILLDNYNEYSNLTINVSERYKEDIKNGILNTKQIGYFPYEILSNNLSIKNGRIYVQNDEIINIDNYKKIKCNEIYDGFSENKEINEITVKNNKKDLIICEYEPYKGYEYMSNPCHYIYHISYSGEVIKFINNNRKYTLRLMKQDPNDTLLDGAKFKISYLENDDIKEVVFTTGSFRVNANNYNFIVYKHDNDNPILEQIENDYYELNNANPGRYYYYLTNTNLIDENKLKDNYIDVIDGGFNIIDLPYSSSVTVEELEAPKGYMITEAKYVINPNIPYSDITFRNYRVNYFDIYPNIVFEIPKTCVD